MNDYAFTVKFVEAIKKDCIPSDYEEVFQEWGKLGCVIETKVYEQDSRGVCHSHGIVQIPKTLIRKNMGRKGLHMKLDVLTNRQGWLAYIRKAQKATRMFPIKAVGKAEVPVRSASQKVTHFSPDIDEELETNDNELFKRITTKLFKSPKN